VVSVLLMCEGDVYQLRNGRVDIPRFSRDRSAELCQEIARRGFQNGWFEMSVAVPIDDQVDDRMPETAHLLGRHAERVGWIRL
jgi:hypothetical protein